MSNILYFEDFKKTYLSSAFCVETRFFEHMSANHNTCDETDKEEELEGLLNDIKPMLNEYIDTLHSIDEIDELIDSLQRAFNFLNKEINYT